LPGSYRDFSQQEFQASLIKDNKGEFFAAVPENHRIAHALSLQEAKQNGIKQPGQMTNKAAKTNH